jgi:hypothetical protein
MACIVHREADRIGVFLLDSVHDILIALAKAEVDDFHAGVPQDTGHDLDATVMAVEAKLGQHDA